MNHLKISSILVILLSIVHLAATATFIPPIWQHFPRLAPTYTYMFIMTGIGLLFVGTVQLFISNKQITGDKLIALKWIGLSFVVMTAIGAVVSMPSNIFAYIFLVIAIYQLIGTTILNKDETLI